MIVWFMFSVCFLFKKNEEKHFKSIDNCLIVLLLPNSLIIAIFMTIAHML